MITAEQMDSAGLIIRVKLRFKTQDTRRKDINEKDTHRLIVATANSFPTHMLVPAPQGMV